MDHDHDNAHDQETPPVGLVVIGSSAGGIDALLAIVSRLPTDLPVPVIVAQHLDPHHRSHLGDLLASRSNLPVRTVSGPEPLRPGTIHVVPPGYDLEVTDHAVDLRDEGAGRSRPSIDRLLISAARIFRDALVVVVLTGTGHDGAAGAQAVKGYGGTVIVQDPESARFPDMPASVPTAAVDIAAEVDQIGQLLGDLTSGAYGMPPPEHDGELRQFLERVREQTGLDFSAYKRPTLERRLGRRMLGVGAASVGDYQAHLERHPAELQRLVGSFLIKVTRFFRDTDLFDHLREHVLPALIAEARKRGELRLWSAGCATGEEAYSLAMLVSDLLADEDEPLPVRIFATDVAPEAIDFARHGVYPAAALEDLPPDMIERHFTRLDGAWEVRKEVRGLVIFGEHDLSRRAPFPRIDLVLCRNVLIYFTPDLQRRALQLFAFSLRPGGCLALGKAESVSPLPEYFTLEQTRLKVFRRGALAAPVPVGNVSASPPRRSSAMPSPRPRLHGSFRDTVDAERRQRLSAEEVRIMDTMSVGIVTVEPNYHIRTINVAARQLLGIHTTGVGEDLVHRTPAELSPHIRAALDATFRGESTSGIHRVTSDVVEDGGRDVMVISGPVVFDDSGTTVDAALLEVTDMSAMARGRRDVETERDRYRIERDDLQQRLAAAIDEVRNLRAADQTMAREHGRLRADNEQLQVASEEAQAAAEEIETLNEEQQAANEELETLNEELQATVEELNTTNADLQARTVELEAMTTTLENQRQEIDAERVRLRTVLASMGEAVLVLGDDGEVVMSNTAWDQELGPFADLAPESELGLPLPDDVWSVRRLVADAPLTLDFTLADSQRDRRWFEASVRPYEANDGQTGGLLVVRDITDRSLRRLQEQFLAVASHELRTPMTALSGSLQLIGRRLSGAQNEAELEPLIMRAREQMRRLELLLTDMTDVARLRGGMLHLEHAPVNLSEVVHDAVESAGDVGSRAVPVRFDAPDEPIVIPGDAPRLEQVLLNLLTNAFRHAPGTERVDVRLARERGEAVIEVQDYGAGIPENKRSTIFSQFQQSSDQALPGSGLGLGLFIAREIVTAHGGTIEVTSAPEEGARFEIRLPFRDGEGQEAEDERAVGELSGKER